MKKAVFLFILVASMCCYPGISAVIASANSTAAKTVSVELTLSSTGAGGSQFVLSGLQTPATPSYTCSKTSTLTGASGNGTSVHFALIDTYGVDKVKITVKGQVVGKLGVINATYFDQSFTSIPGVVSVRQLK